MAAFERKARAAFEKMTREEAAMAVARAQAELAAAHAAQCAAIEARLKADLLERYRSRLTPEQIDAFCAQPSYDACRGYVEEVTGS